MSFIKLPKKSINFFKINQDKIFNSGNLAEGPWNKSLSEKIKDITNSKYAICVNSNGSGLVALLLIFKKFFGREKAMIQSNTMYGVKTMVNTAGLDLVNYINCQVETLMPSFKDVKEAISSYRGDKNKLVILLSDIGGNINPDIQKIAKFLKKNNILLLEDAAHSFGSTLNKRFAGTFGDAGVYSYYATKAIFAGEGGIAVTNNDKIASYLKDFIIYDRFKQKLPIGCNIRLSELQALMIYSVVKYYKEIISNKKEIAQKYLRACKKNDIKYISQENNRSTGNYYKFTIISSKNKVNHEYPRIKTTTSKVYDYALGRSNKIPKQHLCLPIWYDLDKFTIDRVIEELNR